jgi:hypothetical protein
MSTLRLTTISNQTGSSSVPSETVINGSAKAWVNFNGTGTVAIRASFNVSSITDNGTGDYTVNFATAFADANMAMAGFARVSGSLGFFGGTNDAVFSTTSARFGTFNSGATTNTDALFVTAAFFR